jgi:hypothetical protein
MSWIMFRMLMSAILTLVATGDGDGSAAPDRANSLAGKCVRGKMKGGSRVFNSPAGPVIGYLGSWSFEKTAGRSLLAFKRVADTASIETLSSNTAGREWHL